MQCQHPSSPRGTARLVHEVLIVHRPRPGRLVDRLRVRLLARDRLLKASRDRIADGRDPADLLRGSQRLEQAREFLTLQVVPVPRQATEPTGAGAWNRSHTISRAE